MKLGHHFKICFLFFQEFQSISYSSKNNCQKIRILKYINPSFVLFFCLLNYNVSGQSRPEVLAKRSDEPIKVNGDLDEKIWETVNPITEFVQRLPLDGGEPSEKSEMRILYDDNYLYFGFIFLIVNLKKFVRPFLIEVVGFTETINWKLH